MLLILLLLTLIVIGYYFLSRAKKSYRFWKNKGVAQLNPYLFYGDTKDVMFQKMSLAEFYRDAYWKFKKMGVKYGGVYDRTRRVWVLVHPDIIKLIMIKAFPHFSAHNRKFADTLFFNNLFHMKGENWKDMRKKLTPTFTSGKMRMMYDMLLQKTVGLTDLVGDMIKSGESPEIKQLLARFTTDVIGTCGFGIECDSISDEKSEFFKNGQEIFGRIANIKIPSPIVLILAVAGLINPIRFDLSDVEDFFRKIVNETVNYREQNKIVRKDFLHLMIQLKNNGIVTDIVSEKDLYQKTGQVEGLSMEEIAGQCMLFFAAGFETSSTTMAFALLELTQNQDVQNKLRQEIREVLKKYDGALTYDALQEMTYCDNVISETLRKFPPVPNITRWCTKTYRVPNTDLEIPMGTLVQIPILAVQNDPEYFPEPEKFIPDRFNSENKSKIIHPTYIPFGDGPRQCLGLRFAIMQSKAGIASLINRYSFTLNKKTRYPPKFVSASPMLLVDGGIYLEAKEVK
nr:cytochrome P450 6BX7 [Pagiophloeus tsushimanus]